MANDSTLKRRLTRMGKNRVEALERQARQQVALDLLAESGEVTSTAVDARLAETWNAPSDEAVANAVAAKAAAAVEFEAGELDRLRESAARATARVAKFRDRLADVERAEANANRAVAEAEARVEEARQMAALAAEQGDPDAAPPGGGVAVDADTANANTED